MVPFRLVRSAAAASRAVGEGVDELRVGEEVLAVAPFAFSSHVLTRAELAVRKPTRWSFEEAATLPIAFLTAAYALEHLGHLSAGERVLIHSATGGVGLAAVQLARRAGAEIFATAGTPEKRDYLKSLGIAHVMDSRSLAFADEVMERTDGRGVDVVLNSLAGEALVRSLETLADYGRFLEIGKRDVYGNSRLGLRPFRKNLSFHAIDLDRLIRERPALLGQLLRQIVRDAEEGRLAPLPHRVYPIAEAVSAFRFMQQSKHIGKIVLSLHQRPAAVALAETPISFRPDATYLITGGLGGFGLAVARWMVERGARHLALLGRRGIHSDRSRQAVEDLEQRGARVVVHRADVANENDLAAVLARIDARWSAAARRPPRRDGSRRRAADQPRSRPHAARAGPEGAGCLEPPSADARSSARFLRDVLVAVERVRPCRPGQLRGGQSVSRRPGLASPGARPAGPDRQLGLSWRGRLSCRTSAAGRMAGASRRT